MHLRVSFFLLLFCCCLFAQEYPSRNYTTNDGLSNNAVRALFIDKDHVLWIGTENGVSRLVNGQFQNYTEEDGLGHNTLLGYYSDC